MSQPDYGEQALEIADQLTRSGGIDLIVVDSVAALTPKAEIEGDMGDAHMGLQARLMSQALRKLTAVTFKQNTTIIFINQLRQKIGVVFGNPETTTGGNALKFYASVRLDIRKTGAIKKDEEATGTHVRVKVVKNKCAPPFRQAEFDVMFGTGINVMGEVIDLGTTHGLIEKSGAWFMLDGERIGQGRDNACAFLAENPEIVESLRERLLSAMKIGGAAGAAARRGRADRGGGGGMSVYTLAFREDTGPSCDFGPEERLDVAVELMTRIGGGDPGSLLALPAGYVAAPSAAQRDQWAQALVKASRNTGVGIVFGIDIEETRWGMERCPRSFVYASDRGQPLLWGATPTGRAAVLGARTVTLGALRATVLFGRELFGSRAVPAVEAARPELVIVLGHAGPTKKWLAPLAALDELAPTLVVHQALTVHRPVSPPGPRGWRPTVSRGPIRDRLLPSRSGWRGRPRRGKLRGREGLARHRTRDPTRARERSRRGRDRAGALLRPRFHRRDARLNEVDRRTAIGRSSRGRTPRRTSSTPTPNRVCTSYAHRFCSPGRMTAFSSGARPRARRWQPRLSCSSVARGSRARHTTSAGATTTWSGGSISRSMPGPAAASNEPLQTIEAARAPGAVRRLTSQLTPTCPRTTIVGIADGLARARRYRANFFRSPSPGDCVSLGQRDRRVRQRRRRDTRAGRAPHRRVLRVSRADRVPRRVARLGSRARS